MTVENILLTFLVFNIALAAAEEHTSRDGKFHYQCQPNSVLLRYDITKINETIEFKIFDSNHLSIGSNRQISKPRFRRESRLPHNFCNRDRTVEEADDAERLENGKYPLWCFIALQAEALETKSPDEIFFTSTPRPECVKFFDVDEKPEWEMDFKYCSKEERKKFTVEVHSKVYKSIQTSVWIYSIDCMNTNINNYDEV
ncbi:hypothetical protein KQX54_006586 [Cotesia glomerata]|uniref:Candidate secreted effector protein n=1 Tax=Cotesia glomerata TaxID=32391 RepID=A0AAV7ID15_COTGL|nr:hypothetical protein KQX54_006586 [Cotesia glomerata]